jgi:predicted enzyme related to lactoylglutathione lyase
MSSPIKEFAFVLHPVGDIPRARQFYEKLLGLKAGMEIEFAPGAWWIEYDVGGVALAVSNGAPASAGSGTSIALEVDDLDAMLASVKGANIALTQEPVEFPVCRMFGINSPDGHPIMFHRRKAPSLAGA